jgi:hypothetical protein
MVVETMDSAASDALARAGQGLPLAHGVHSAVGLASDYLADLLRSFDAPLSAQPGPGADDAALGPRRRATAEDLADLLCDRRFTHLSQTQARRYRPAICVRLQSDIDAGRPLRFFYDIGGGYHAGLRPDFADLRFSPGLGELLALRQIRRFTLAVEPWYAPGLHFSLVIDDLCAWAANDIALDKTQGYRMRLCALIDAVRMAATVDVLAESALCTSAHFQAAVAGEPAPAPPPQLTAQALENVSRFVGHACTPTEALEHLARYQRAQAVSDRLLAPHIQGVRLTQRASDTCMGFRSFPGGDSRLQTGAVVLTVGPGDVVRPLLLTSRNVGDHEISLLPFTALPHNWPLAAGDAQLALRRVGHATPSFGSPAPANPRHPQ